MGIEGGNKRRWSGRRILSLACVFDEFGHEYHEAVLPPLCWGVPGDPIRDKSASRLSLVQSTGHGSTQCPTAANFTAPGAAISCTSSSHAAGSADVAATATYNFSGGSTDTSTAKGNNTPNRHFVTTAIRPKYG